MMELRGWSLALASVENFILINTALSVVSFAVASLLRSGSRHPLSMAKLYAAALIAPPVVSAWLVCASLLPALLMGSDRWNIEHKESHTLHLLNAFTSPLDPALGYTAVGFALLTSLVAVYLAWSARFRLSQVIDRLDIGAEPAPVERVRQVEAVCRKYGLAVGLVVSSYPFSFVWGYINSKLIVSTGLLNALSSEELAGVLEHEAAHHARRDNLMKWTLTVCRYLSPAFPLTGKLYRWWTEQIEMVCDEIAARRTAAPVELAGALVRVKRLTLAAPQLRAAGSGFFGNDEQDFEHRVTRVLALSNEAESGAADYMSRSCAQMAMVVGAIFALSLIALLVVSPLAVHRAIEAALNLI